MAVSLLLLSAELLTCNFPYILLLYLTMHLDVGVFQNLTTQIPFYPSAEPISAELLEVYVKSKFYHFLRFIWSDLSFLKPSTANFYWQMESWKFVLPFCFDWFHFNVMIDLPDTYLLTINDYIYSIPFWSVSDFVLTVQVVIYMEIPLFSLFFCNLTSILPRFMSWWF